MTNVSGCARADGSAVLESERRLVELLARVTYERLRDGASVTETSAGQTDIAEETAA
jgi:hypothetical protein